MIFLFTSKLFYILVIKIGANNFNHTFLLADAALGITNGYKLLAINYSLVVIEIP